MNLKKYDKLRKKFEYKPVEWLEFSVREHNFCRNRQIEYVYQLIDTNLLYNIRGFSVMKVFRLFIATLKRKTGIDFQFIGIGDGIFRIIPKFIVGIKQKAESGDAQAMLEYSEYLKEFYSLQESHEWNTKSARAGSAMAMASEGNYILYGWVAGTLEDAFEYYKKSAEAGIKMSNAAMADCYLYGFGIEQNFQKARECYKKASRWKYRKIVKQLSRKDFHLETDGETVLKKIREFYN